jgi:hypothetical protein
MFDDGLFNVREFGAAGDGKDDDTAAIQEAIDAAAGVGGTVLLPNGVYAVSRLKLRSHTGMLGYPTWSYRDFGGAVLRLADADAPCLLDLTGAVGVTLNGLCLDGGFHRVSQKDKPFRGSAHGIMFAKDDYGKEEDNPRIERCRIGGFAGDGIHLGRIWCWSVRHCMVCFNRGHGIYTRGWDGFLLDTWLSGNVGAGYASHEENSSTTITANRIEWNRAGGIVMHGAKNYNITGNYFDRAGGCAIRIAPGEDRTNQNITIVGNLIFRSGRPEWTEGDHESAHVWFDSVAGLVFSSNTLRAWRDDGDRGHFSPRFGIVYQRLRDSVIKNNVMNEAALEKLIVDLHDHGENVIVADNVGSLFVPPKDGKQ